MNTQSVRELLQKVQRGEVELDSAVELLKQLPVEDLGFANVDHHRALRQGLPEVVLGESKTPEQIIGIAQALLARSSNVLITRVENDKAQRICEVLPALEYKAEARVVISRDRVVESLDNSPVAIVTAGTSDIPIAEEAAETLAACGAKHQRVFDVGVAGIHRVVRHLDLLQNTPVAIVVAGMEGALASVVGGLIAGPVIAVPTSVGYGTALGGFTALFGMLTGCASGVSVVNIDNGFGAAMAAFRILRRMGPAA
ncbi:MAG: nickel pincer cofactor biosynthesis protein LarB [Polyangiaceae bacterium]|nr:nickel pincer cofactor biosynthesis protein LarB [Myxococcales bacterium]MCB9588664.1 nickel pincer cofactor biosynthesis protein LarB [Polyangiaceae bacterium]MCB9605222.1 nickel pincer cofactor biosynthesis protein LarB [Polyangiaceae bacterium]